MSEKRHELILIAAALVIFASLLLYSVFDSPKYNGIQAVEITDTVKSSVVTTGSSNGTVVNINTATAQELETLEEIGEAKAQAIIEYREKNGKFRSIEELTEVEGIGESILSKNLGRITV